MSDCLTDLAVDTPDAAVPTIDCMRNNPGQVASPFDPARLGIYATGAGLEWFQYLFMLGHPEDGTTMFADFKNRVWMPRGGHNPFTQDEFDVVAEWFVRGLPKLDDLIPETPTGTCTPSTTQAIKDHVATMATQGWQAANAENGITMFGCAGATNPHGCLTAFADAETTGYGATWDDDLPAQTIRILKETDYGSSYWTRSSADGRYVAQGGGSSVGGGSTIIDLSDGSYIGTDAYYDPGFFPDNSGLAFQGDGAFLCNQSLLATDDYIDYHARREVVDLAPRDVAHAFVAVPVRPGLPAHGRVTAQPPLPNGTSGGRRVPSSALRRWRRKHRGAGGGACWQVLHATTSAPYQRALLASDHELEPVLWPRSRGRGFPDPLHPRDHQGPRRDGGDEHRWDLATELGRHRPQGSGRLADDRFPSGREEASTGSRDPPRATAPSAQRAASSRSPLDARALRSAGLAVAARDRPRSRHDWESTSRYQRCCTSIAS